MKTGLLTTLFYLLLITTQAQNSNFINRYWNKLINDTTHVSKPKFLAYPTLGYSPETNLEFGLSSLYVYYAKEDTTNRLSEVNGFSFVTLENQYGLFFDHNIYTDKSKWIFPGRFRFQSFPLLYYGIGPNSPAKHIALVETQQLQIKERALRQVLPNLFFGLEVDFQKLRNVNFIQTSETFFQKPRGSEGSTNLAFGLGLVYDKRHNVLNVREGIFSELAVLRYANTWGSDYNFNSIITDSRFYKRVNKRDVFAAQVLGQFNSGDIPFNQLALFGGENINRGYYYGRFRDNNQLTAQVEYRFLPLPFAKRWGAAVFGSTGTVFDKFKNLSPDDVVWSGGGGIRFLLFPKKDIFTRIDVAFTKEKPGFYLFIGEAF
ncbi:BamA/TamA family outer membrane protein [Adhaeribacter aquaticus]|uniref:BamA/TamA family outer membrane protein n=1 Tax=Adhaeribacter aquaticus TaxID=299567 RepID=UPI000427EE22|nr:BamA/TamA family outer membrane protein [Adhaeribacter aquaticus]